MLEGKLLPRVALIQGAFYLATGAWSLIDIDSFQAVTGPKTDLWLVRTVGVLVAIIGAVLLTAVRRRYLGVEIMLLGAGSALGLATIDIVYVLGRTISPVYLADAVAEIVLASGWALGWRRV